MIEDACIELAEGLNCFTGQTGAGKSLVMGALEILLGLRSTTGVQMLRPGASEARISGVFQLQDPQLTSEVSRQVDQAVEPGQSFLITRKLLASGRSSASVNGQPATAAMVRGVGQLLVDVHGRHDQQYLLKSSNQLLILDAFGQSSLLRQRFSDLYSKVRVLEKQRDELLGSQTLGRQQLELYEFQAGEIDSASPVAGEFHELKARYTLLNNLQRIKRDASAAYGALYDCEGAILERLHMVVRVLDDLVQLDDQMVDIAEQMRTATLTLQDGAFELGRYADRLDVGGGELAEVEQRLNLINRLLAKYGDQAQGRVNVGSVRRNRCRSSDEDPMIGLLAYRQEIGQQIQRLQGRNQRVLQIDDEIAVLKKDLVQLGTQLGQARRRAAEKLTPLVEAQLRQLGMNQVRFEVAFETVEDQPEPAGPAGLDRVEMLVKTNPGQPARPLRKIASSGELSRIMLGLKSILAHSDRISVLVFDEIDANIGGRMGTVIGTKLRQLARRSPTGAGVGHQVLCVTHLPQIAAFADRHLHISKAVVNQGRAKQTRTTVSVLQGRSRVNELAEMLTGKRVTDTTRRQVREMLTAADG